MPIHFKVSKWSAWVQGDSRGLSVADTPPPIPAMLRRRLGTVGRAAAGLVMDTLPAQANPVVVFCSRHGDIERTLKVLHSLTCEEPVSPMDFSLSVHNAIAGILSIHNGVTAGISSISACGEELVPALLEAAAFLSADCRQVMCVHCEVPLPEIFHADEPGLAYASCYILSADEGVSLTLSHAGEEREAAPSGSLPPALQFHEFLGSAQANLAITHNGGRWTIARN